MYKHVCIYVCVFIYVNVSMYTLISSSNRKSLCNNCCGTMEAMMGSLQDSNRKMSLYLYIDMDMYI